LCFIVPWLNLFIFTSLMMGARKQQVLRSLTMCKCLSTRCQGGITFSTYLNGQLVHTTISCGDDKERGCWIGWCCQKAALLALKSLQSDCPQALQHSESSFWSKKLTMMLLTWFQLSMMALRLSTERGSTLERTSSTRQL
jgi:hypothetical protein